MYTPTQLEVIGIFGKKELTNGCIITYKNQIGTIIGKKGVHFLITYEKQWKEFETKIGEISRFFIEEDCEILGHEPQLFPDVARVVEENRTHQVHSDIAVLNDRIKIYNKWIPFKPTISLLEQSEETLQQLISLFE